MRPLRPLAERCPMRPLAEKVSEWHLNPAPRTRLRCAPPGAAAPRLRSVSYQVFGEDRGSSRPVRTSAWLRIRSPRRSPCSAGSNTTVLADSQHAIAAGMRARLESSAGHMG